MSTHSWPLGHSRTGRTSRAERPDRAVRTARARQTEHAVYVSRSKQNDSAKSLVRSDRTVLVRPAYNRLKRSIDVCAAGFGLLLLSPVIAVIAVAVRLRLGAPVLFLQRRPGFHGQVFTMIKFRTMREIDEAHHCVTNEERMTAFGSWLRSTSPDELPSLWNVVRGDMTLVGPRPLIVEYLDLYTPEQARRHDVRPGITGLAQVSGRNGLSWEEKFELDVEYVDTRTLGLDLRILARTVTTVLRREGIAAEGHVTGVRFTGTVATPPLAHDNRSCNDARNDAPNLDAPNLDAPNLDAPSRDHPNPDNPIPDSPTHDHPSKEPGQ